MDKVLYIMPNADLRVLAAVVQSICSSELAMKGILNDNGADIEPSGIQEFRDMIMKELERRKLHDK